MLLTNRFEPQYNYAKIDRDFDVYVVTKESKSLYRTKILDIPTADFKARAVQYLWGAKALVLFDKEEVSESAFRDALQGAYHDVTVQKIDILNEQTRKDTFYGKDYLLANLLINTLKSPKIESYRYNNLIGKLYYRDPSWKKKDYIWFLQINFEPGMLLKLSVKTFRKKTQYGNKPCFLFDEATGAFRKKLKEDDNRGQLYVEGAYPKGRNTVDFIQYRDFKSFCKSKMGVMERFLRDVKVKLRDYMTLEEKEVKDSTHYKSSKNQDWRPAVRALLREWSVNIEDCCHSTESENMIAQLAQKFGDDYDSEVQISALQKEMLNLRIIHHKEYYDDYPGKHDPHDDDISGYIVQHLTVEDFFEDETIDSHAFDKIMQELLIKADNLKKRMTAFDWCQLSLDCDYTFAISEKRNMDYSDREIIYRWMTVHHDGRFEYGYFCSADDELSEKDKSVMNAYERLKTNNFRCLDMECLMFNSPDNAVVIGKTKEFTRPNIHMLYDALYQTQPETLIQKAVLLDYLEELVNDKPECAEAVNELKEELKSVGDTIKRGELHHMMNFKKKPHKEINRWLHHKHDLWIYSELKSADSGMNLSSLTGINFYPNEYNVNSMYYYVGAMNTPKDKVSRACTIRQVCAESKLPPADLLFPMMAVDFVRNGQYTVVPFPIKYLREYFAKE